jgi:hypothetical protein
VRKDLVLGIPLERERDPVGFEASGTELVDQLLHQQFGAAPDEGNLGFADEDGSNAQRRRKS